jgi:hypothetical protein
MICSMKFVVIITFYDILKNLLQKYLYSKFFQNFHYGMRNFTRACNYRYNDWQKILLMQVQQGTTSTRVLRGLLLRMVFGTKGSDMICTGTRQGNALSELILVRASICFVPHTKYCYPRYSLSYQYRWKYLLFLRVELNYYGTRKR